MASDDTIPRNVVGVWRLLSATATDQNGILPVPMRIEEVELLADEMKASPGNARITVDLENSVVISPTGRTIPFQVDAKRQHAMLNGLDDIAQTMTHKSEIEAWQKADQSERPWVWL